MDMNWSKTHYVYNKLESDLNLNLFVIGLGKLVVVEFEVEAVRCGYTPRGASRCINEIDLVSGGDALTRLLVKVALHECLNKRTFTA